MIEATSPPPPRARSGVLPLLLVCALATAAAAQSTLELQEGRLGGAVGTTAATTLDPTRPDRALEGPTLFVGTERVLLRWPQLYGPGGLDPTSRIQGATLDLHVLSHSAAANARLRLLPVADAERHGPWTEPDAAGLGGPSWALRDTRSDARIPWAVAGGEALRVPAPYASSAPLAQGWMRFDVSALLAAQAGGFGDQGWVVLADGLPSRAVHIASDDHPDATLRPRLTITTLGTTQPFNRVPNAGGLLRIVRSDGEGFVLPLPTTDADGQALSWTLRRRARHGRVLVGPLVHFRPGSNTSPSDRFEVVPHDGIASGEPLRVEVSWPVDPALGDATIVANARRDALATISPDVGQRGPLSSGGSLNLEADTAVGLMDLRGWRSQVPANAVLESASLELHLSEGRGLAASSALRLTALGDPMGLGGFDAGSVDWSHRGSAGAAARPWLVPGGEALPGSPTEEALAGYAEDSRISFDVTAAMRAARGPHGSSGFRLELRGPGRLSLHGADAGETRLRPRLHLRWRTSSASASVPNRAPRAVAGSDARIVPGARGALDASGTYDPDGDPITSTWFAITPGLSFGDPSALQTTVTAANPGLYEVALVVSDGQRLAIDTLRVIVGSAEAGNQPPVAHAGANLTRTEGQWARFDGSASFDPEGQPLTARWEVLSGPTARVLPIPSDPLLALVEAPAVTAASAPGRVALRLTVDDGVTSASDFAILTVLNGPNLAPIADAGADLLRDPQRWVVLDGGASSDPDANTSLGFQWAQVAGTPVLLEDADTARAFFKSPAPALAEDLEFALRVSDGELTATDTVVVRVSAGGLAFSGNAQSLTPYRDSLTRREAAHLLRRAGFGGTPADLQQLLSVGLTTAIDTWLQPVATPALDAEAEAVLPSVAPGFVFRQPSTSQVHRWWLVHLLGVPFENVLKERMAYFLHDLYAASGAVAGGSNERHWRLKHLQLFREDPFPQYRDFLVALSRDELMLEWLDGFSSTERSPNENYAREFWELFTLGEIDPFTGLPNYTEAEIQEASRAFTGWREYDPTQYAGDQRFAEFQARRHDGGNKTVLSQTGPWRDEDIVDITLMQPQAAEFFCHRLFEHLVHEAPTVTTVRALAAGLRSDGWEIAPTLRRILRSEAMFSAQAHRSKVRNPTEFAIGFSRATGLSISATTLQQELSDLAHELGQPPSVKGFPEGEFWLGESSMAYRARLLNELTAPRTRQSSFDPTPLLPPLGQRNAARTVAHILHVMDLQLSDPADFRELRDYLDTEAAANGATRVNPFDGDDPAAADVKLRGLLFLLGFALPDSHLN